MLFYVGNCTNFILNCKLKASIQHPAWMNALSEEINTSEQHVEQAP